MRRILGILAALVALAGPETAGAADAVVELRVAAAADLKYALEEVVGRYRQVRPAVKVSPIYGSSGRFHAQIVNGAPFDLYLSADAVYPRRLVEAGVAVAGSEFPYAVGRVVVWVPRESGLPVEREGIRALLAPAAARIAIANPEHAPYGRAAEGALRRYGLHEQVRERLVFGENAAQTAQFVQTRAADAGIIPLSLALAPAMASDGRFWLVPLDAHPRLEQVGVRLTASSNPAEAQRFGEYLGGPEARAVLKRYGFLLPGE